MRRIGKFFVICLAGVILLLVQNFLFPLVYRVKEPRFLLPVELNKKVRTLEDLPIRHDNYGDGEFGAKRKGARVHNGLDIGARLKSPVYASKSGWARTYFAPGGYGNLVVINHPGKWQSRYGHLHKCSIKKFHWVRQGAIIGSVGKTGNADLKEIEPHLHFEIRHKGKPIDPAEELISK